MSQMCPNCSFDNPDEAKTCSNCPAPLRGLLGYRTVLSNRYQVISVLGCGAMGAVYLAEDQRLVGRRCAVKENRPEADIDPAVLSRLREQFLAEASVLARLDHAGLPKVSDYFIEHEREYLVMDYVEGEDLASMLQRTQQPLSEESVLNWANQVLDALAYLHNQRPQPIIHRDIKPANIRVNLQGKVKLVDFGLVKLLDSKNPETRIELRGLGTPAYAPLEQFASSNDHTDARSDIYALGATLYHLLTNLYPPDVHQRLLTPEILPPPRRLNPQLSENTEQVLWRAMEIHPSQRYQSAEEMRQALIGSSDSIARAGAKSLAGRAAMIPLTLWVFGVTGLILVLLILGGFAMLLFGGIGGGTGLGNETASPQPVVVVQDQPTRNPLGPAAQTPSDVASPTSTLVVPVTVPEEEGTVEAMTATPEPTASPTTEPTLQPRAGLNMALAGTIAYPVFNGTDYDLYFGQANGSGTRLFRLHASQPAFSPDGNRIAFRSWRLDAWGLMTVAISGGEPKLIANFVEDQLPTWTPDGSEIIFLSRRAGDRKSRLLTVGSSQERSEGLVLGEGEYPSLGQNGQLAFKGWGSTGPGLRLATPKLEDIQVLTNIEEDTAPALSPDGQQIAFMSRRDGNWEIYIIKADGSGLLRLTENQAEDGLPAWSPDGRMLAFASNRGGSWAVWAMTPGGSSPRQLFVMEGSPDGFVGTDRYASRGWTEERISWTQ